MGPRQPRPFIMRTLNDLRMVKAELTRSQEDFGGHKASAIDACDKATAELEAVLKTLPPPQRPMQHNPNGAPPPTGVLPTPPTGTPPPPADARPTPVPQ